MRFVLALVLLCGIAGADDKPWAKDVPQEKQDRAFSLYEEANKLFADGEYKRALEKYEAAIAEWDHPSIRYNLAVCLINLDRPVDAYQNLTQALRYGEAPLGKDLYNEGLNYQKLLSKQVAEVEVEIAERDARVSLDGKPLTLVGGHASTMVAVNESHEVIASKPGYQTMRRPLEKLPAGQKTTIELKLERLEVGGRWKPWAVIAGGAIAAGAGAYTYGLARSNISDYEKAVETKCPCASDADLGAAATLPDRARTKEIAAYSLFALGGATIATGVVLMVRGGGTHVAPVATKDSAGVSFSGSW